MAFLEKGVELGTGIEKGSEYGGDPLQRGKGNQMRERGGSRDNQKQVEPGELAGGGGRERSGLDGRRGRVLRKDDSGEGECRANGVQDQRMRGGYEREGKRRFA